MGKKIFRHTPHRAADAMKIIVGNKTNATIRDLEETEEDIEEIEGTVVSIDKDKINGDGWVVKDEDGNLYNCTCASNMYELPEAEEYGGVYYPTETVKVTITKNPVLRNNTITEITSLKDDEESLDISKWKHKDKATTIIAKPKSAISISNGLISFNYNNKNEVKVDKESTKIEGEKTVIKTKKLQIDSKDIGLADESLEDFAKRMVGETTEKQYKPVISDVDVGVDAIRQNNLSQLTIDLQKTYIPANSQRIITDLKDPSMTPEKMQRQPLMVNALSGTNIDELYIYPNGLITIQTSSQVPKSEAQILSTHNWITSQHGKKNILTVQVKTVCKCCGSKQNGNIEYFNYCPICQTWNTLSEGYDGYITCGNCHHKWCEGCGHPTHIDCSNNTYDLKEYISNMIGAVGTPCEYCKNDIPSGKVREYANYCPVCHKWGKLHIETKYTSDGDIRRVLQCSSCNEFYCTNCSISQSKKFIPSFVNKEYYYKDFIERYKKIIHVRDD